jgi:hypothetical protein
MTKRRAAGIRRGCQRKDARNLAKKTSKNESMDQHRAVSVEAAGSSNP